VRFFTMATPTGSQQTTTQGADVFRLESVTSNTSQKIVRGDQVKIKLVLARAHFHGFHPSGLSPLREGIDPD
ncbi:hypothetical protein ACC743_38225, partial [Rhizobium ruizarguesonis]